MAVPSIERYEVLEELGQGGMSVVYHARDRQLNRNVALKVLHDFLARQEEARRRFHREAVAVAKLRHPGIVEIYDYSGPDAAQSYIVCELIDGPTLRTLVEEEGPIPHPELAALITAELVRALRHAHEQGIIHRDLKPENIMVTRDGRLKLMDFGIAQIMGGATQLTATGTLLGSPAHMAPEMIDGQPSDHRSDIFSVGTIMYWLATGALPFSAPNPSALFRQILEGTFEAPQAIQPRMGNGLARIIDRALAVDLSTRYQDISELQNDLQRELEAVDLVPVEAKSRAYLCRMRPFADDFRCTLVARLAEAGQRALAEENLGRAMDRFNRVLAIEPDHAEVQAAVRRVGRQQAFAARLRRALVSVVTMAGIVGLGLGLYGLRPQPPSVDGAPRSKAIGQSIGQPVGSKPGLGAIPTTASGQAPEEPTAHTSAPDEPPRAVVAPSAPDPILKPASTPPGTGAAEVPPAPSAATSSASNRADRSRESTTEASAAALEKPETAGSTDGPSSSPVEGETVTAVAFPAVFPLLVRIRRGWADISLNGETVATGAYRTRLELKPGRHTIQITNKYGRQTPRTIVVSDDGTMVESLDDASDRPIRGELLMTPPGPEEL